VVLRVVLLAAGGLWLLARAAQVWRGPGPADPAAAVLQSRLAIVQALVAALALLTAAAAASSLRRRRRAPTLRLREPAEDDEPQ
jgi:hypothetical protein